MFLAIFGHTFYSLLPVAVATYGKILLLSNIFHGYVFLWRVDRAEDCNRDKCPKLMEVCPDGGNCYGMSSSRPLSQTLPIRFMVVLFSNWWLWRKDMLLSDWNVMWIRQVRSLIFSIQNQNECIFCSFNSRVLYKCPEFIQSRECNSFYLYTSTFSVQITIYYLEVIMSHWVTIIE